MASDAFDKGRGTCETTYEQPELIVHGSVGDLTAGTGDTPGDLSAQGSHLIIQ